MTETLLRVPEVARTLGIEGVAVYRLIDRGELRAGKGPDGLVYVSAEALREYEHQRAEASHGRAR
jgi:hypothetical protein